MFIFLQPSVWCSILALLRRNGRLGCGGGGGSSPESITYVHLWPPGFQCQSATVSYIHIESGVNTTPIRISYVQCTFSMDNGYVE